MNKHVCTIDDLFDLFEDVLSPADVLTSKLMAQISTAITKERLKLSMNQTDFAQHIGATQSLVSRWEHGDYNFSIRKIAEIAEKLNLDINITMHSMSLTKNCDEYDYSTLAFQQAKTICYSSPKETQAARSSYLPKTYTKSIHSSKEENYNVTIC